jgi:hypothetical protein
MFMLTIVRTSIRQHQRTIRHNLLKPGPSCQKTAVCSGADFSEIKFCTQYVGRKFNDELKTIQNEFIKKYVYPVMVSIKQNLCRNVAGNVSHDFDRCPPFVLINIVQ